MTRDEAPDQQSAEVDGGPVGKRRRWLIPLIASAGGLLVVVVGAFVAVHLLNEGRTAQATAQEYFDALAAGDASAANALTVDPPGPEDAPFLTDDVLAAATERISDVEVVAADDPLDVFDQNVIVRFVLDGKQFTERLTIVRGEPEWGVLRTWRMPHPVAGSVSFLVEGPGTLTIAGLDVDDGAPGGSALLFPAIYPVEAVERTWVESPIETLVVDTEGGLEGITMEPTEALTDEVQRQFDESFRECVAELELDWGNESTDCPLTVFDSDRSRSSGSWEIIHYPAASPVHGGMLYTYTGGEARFTPDDGGAPSTSYGDVALAGTVEVTDDAVTLAPLE